MPRRCNPNTAWSLPNHCWGPVERVRAHRSTHGNNLNDHLCSLRNLQVRKWKSNHNRKPWL
jgi:hypothetical protein